MKTEKELEKIMIEDIQSFLLLSDQWKNNKDYILKNIEKQPFIYRFLSDELKGDRNILMIALKNYPDAFKHASEELQNDISVIRDFAKINKGFLKFVGEKFKNNKEFLLNSLSYDVDALLYCDKVFFEDEEVMLKALKINPDITKILISDNLKNDEKFMLKAIKENLRTIKIINEFEKKYSTRFWMEALKINQVIFIHIPESVLEDDVVLQEVNKIKNNYETEKSLYEDIEKNYGKSINIDFINEKMKKIQKLIDKLNRENELIKIIEEDLDNKKVNNNKIKI